MARENVQLSRGSSAENKPHRRRPGDPAIGWMERGHSSETANEHSEKTGISTVLLEHTLTMKIQISSGLTAAGQCSRDGNEPAPCRKLNAKQEVWLAARRQKASTRVFAGKQLQVTIA